jgi:GGDEF domain-containing protein
LQQVASRLRLVTREADTVARLGGDEFVVLLENLDNTGGCARQHAELVAGKILRPLSADRNEVGRNDKPPHRVTRTAAQWG